MERSFICEYDHPVVSTAAGKLRGFYLDGTYRFRGIKYADAKRFEEPVPVEPWEGIRDAITYGPTAPTILPPSVNPMSPLLGNRHWPANEDCHYVNIWSKSLGSGEKKPVMFWIHGGSLALGSSVESLSYEAENLCRDGDVVVVSVNHRLNILGFLNLAEYGDRYANSANLGIVDLVAALQWVHDNIAAFGGDPDNVTIFGQSGGGAKVRALLQIPSAGGLFHKAVISSAIRVTKADPRMLPAGEAHRVTAAVARGVMAELGLNAGTVERIQSMPFGELAGAWNRAASAIKDGGGNINWMPVANDYYAGDMMVAGPTEKNKSTPLMAGTTICEDLLNEGVFYDGRTPEAELVPLLQKKYGEGADELIRLFRAAYPGKTLLGLMHFDSIRRIGTLDFMDVRAQSAGAPTYNYVLAYDFKFNGGTPAWHASDNALVFKSGARIPVYNEPGVEALSARMSGAWASFAHNGDPNNALIPHWSAYRPDEKATMIFDAECAQRVDYDRELAALHQKHCPPIKRTGRGGNKLYA